MATNTRLLLQDTPKLKTCYHVLFALVAIIGPIAFVIVTTRLIDTNSSLGAHICYRAHDPASCLAIVSEIPSGGSKLKCATLLQTILQKSTLHIRDTIEMTIDVHRRINDPREQAALSDCLELLDLSNDNVVDSILALEHLTTRSHSDVHTWLSAVLTFHITCLDGLNGQSKPIIEPKLNDLMARARTSLAMVVAIAPLKHGVLRPLYGNFPSWINVRDQKFLQAMSHEIKANAIVAKDGTDSFYNITTAVTAAPNYSDSRYVIYVKRGVYEENVKIEKYKTNIMLVGDGQDATIVNGSLNAANGSSIVQSATVAATGKGFIAQDMGFLNTAGPQNYQVVALRVCGDQSVINRCRIDGYQDSLYAQAQRQFYRECYITGTIDFIFGDTSVVFQNSQIVARRPMDGQNNAIMAQGRDNQHHNSGTSIQNCNLTASPDLEPAKDIIKSYLGRPWKKFSRTVVMESYIGDHIDPAGWSEWIGDFALNTLYYGEYLNHGPGAGTRGRVNWSGYNVLTSPVDAYQFTVASLIQGGTWLKSTGVSYTEGL